jgi:small subunit ribosomal protein S18
VGARSNKTLREKAKQSKSAAAAAAMKKFKKKPCSFCRDKVTYIDYKDIATLRKYITDRGKIRSTYYWGMHPTPTSSSCSG